MVKRTVSGKAGKSGARTAEQRVPRYLQVTSALRRRIREGRWPVGARIATVAELQEEFQVARVTVRQAIELLAREGLLRAHQGKGTFVTKAPENDRWLRLATDWEGLIAPIRDNVPHLLRTPHPPRPRIGPDDGTPAPAYAYLRSLQMRRKEPFGLASVHVADAVYRRAPRRFGKRVALAVLLELAGDRVARAHQTFSVGAADIEAARHLRLPMNAPTVEARCVVTDRAGVVLYVGEIVYRGDVVHFDVELTGPVRT